MQKQTLKKLIAMVTFVLAFTVLIGVTNGTPVSAKSSTTNVSGSKQQLVDIVLKPKSQKKLDQFVYQSVDPTSSNYRKFVSSGQFASKFGQSTKNMQKLRQYLKKYHLRTEVYRGNLVMAVKGSTRNVQKAFKVKLVMVSKNKIRYQKTTKKPTVPKSVSKSILAIMGLSSYSTVSNSSREFRPTSLYNRSATTLSQGEIAKHYSPSKFVNRYGISQLYNNGSTGRSKTIGI
ncbi:protease pro-enzyme activation domain-containing protein, partial [Lentilactobacillus hilgardii]